MRCLELHGLSEPGSIQRPLARAPMLEFGLRDSVDGTPDGLASHAGAVEQGLHASQAFDLRAVAAATSSASLTRHTSSRNAFSWPLLFLVAASRLVLIRRLSWTRPGGRSLLHTRRELASNTHSLAGDACVDRHLQQACSNRNVTQ